ncbi:uncharacterized protein BO96DRAFT_461214 [Aspergillus niger CBS 101883]|uniref:uncharacterized protein n=1 Tax=Aspergillus lacticoffeatus (strain CBS 101883) TaxID=1450533 RepID=UPI000D7FA9D7|nr:uncharacterized protein BO96DRAFT_461214 [Aspergillus niger CBS 101883]PYH61708.1 hypothetical protein BO96DRAFT_461214 [Aspergillus niger CBS 101883]
MRFSIISVSLLSLFASSALAVPAASGTLSCSDVNSQLSGYEQRLAKATDTSSAKYQAAQNLVNSAKNLESADCGSSSKRSYYPPESTGLIGEVLNALDSLPSYHREARLDVAPGIVPIESLHRVAGRWRDAMCRMASV